MFGGDLRENPLFIHIVSIGYEFETPVTSCGRITCVTKKYKSKSSKQSRKNSKK